MDYHAFKKWITSKGYAIRSTSKHHEIVDKSGNRMTVFAVHHTKNGKDEVLKYYVAKIRKLIGP